MHNTNQPWFYALCNNNSAGTFIKIAKERLLSFTLTLDKHKNVYITDSHPFDNVKQLTQQNIKCIWNWIGNWSAFRDYIIVL